MKSKILNKTNVLNLSLASFILIGVIFQFKNFSSIWAVLAIIAGILSGILTKEKDVSKKFDEGVNYSLIFGIFSGIGFFLITYFILDYDELVGTFFSISTLISIFLYSIAFIIIHFIGLSLGIFLKNFIVNKKS